MGSRASADRSQESVVVEDGPSLGKLAVSDPPKNHPSHFNGSPCRFDAKEGTLMGPAPTGKNADHVTTCDALLLSQLDVREARSHHRDPTLRALWAWWRAWRSGVVDEIWSKITVSGAEVSLVYEVLVVTRDQYLV